MASAENKVIAGEYNDKPITIVNGQVNIVLDFNKYETLDKGFVTNYELLVDEQRKSVASGVARGLVGGLLLGPVGIVAGGISAKNKGIYQVALEYKDGKKSLIEVDDKIYKLLIKNLF